MKIKTYTIELWKKRENRGYLGRAFYNIARELVTINCVLLEIQRQAGQWENFMVKKMEGFKYALIGGHWHGEAGGGLPRSGACYVPDVGSLFGFLWLILNWNGGGGGQEMGSR